MIKIHKYNESFLFIDCDRDEALNIQSYFEFFAPGYVFHPAFKMGSWDGKIRLFNIKTCRLPIGLLKKLIKNLKRDGFEFSIEDKEELFKTGKKISVQNVLKFAMDVLKIDPSMKPRDYQIFATQWFLYKKKGIILSSTASGKSLIAFLIFNLLQYIYEDFKFLLVVPTKQLVSQMRNDFIKYGENFDDYDDHIHMIWAGKDKHTEKSITISTWQSLQRLDKTYFYQFNCILIDEVHKVTGKELTKIVENCVKAEYKFGMTGTIKNGKSDVMQLEALFGSVNRVSKTKDLMKKNYLSKLMIYGVVLKYPEKLCKLVRKLSFDEEVSFVNKQKIKQYYVCKLADNCKGNTLVLFKKIEYGTALKEYLETNSDKKIFYVDGTVSVENRDIAKEYFEKNDDAILVASYGTFSTGINIKNLPNIIFAESMKSIIQVLQSIGRGLRKHKNKKITNVYDITDSFKIGKRKNFLLKHFFERIGYYEDEEFDYKIKEIQL